MYVVPFMKYSASNNGVTLKLGVEVVQGHWKWRCSIDHNTTFYWSAIVSIAVCCTIFKLFEVEYSWTWSLKVIQTGTIRKIGCDFLFAFHSNYGRIFNRLWDIQRQSIAWPWKLVQGHWKWRRSIDHTTFYWSAIVNIALSGTVFELFDVEWYRDL